MEKNKIVAQERLENSKVDELALQTLLHAWHAEGGDGQVLSSLQAPA